MKEEKLIDQTQLAQSISEKIPYEFADHFLVKPLPPIMVKKEFEEPDTDVPEAKKDENGVAAIDYNETKKTVKEVEANFKKGVVLGVPSNYKDTDARKYSLDVKVGDIVVYKYGQYFDILKDTMIIRTYDIVAVERQGSAEI